MRVENNLHLQQFIALRLNTMDHEEHYGLSPAQIKGLELRLGEARVITLRFICKTSMDLLKNNLKELKLNEAILL